MLTFTFESTQVNYNALIIYTYAAFAEIPTVPWYLWIGDPILWVVVDPWDQFGNDGGFGRGGAIDKYCIFMLTSALLYEVNECV